MRTPGLGDRRLSSTRGVCPIAWTMSPYLPPHGRLSRRGSIIASKSVVPLLDPQQPVFRQAVLARSSQHRVNVLARRGKFLGLLADHLVHGRLPRSDVEQYLRAAAPVRVAGGLLGIELAEPERQLPQNAPHRLAARWDDVGAAPRPADRAPQDRQSVVWQPSGPESDRRRAPRRELPARHVRAVG